MFALKSSVTSVVKCSFVVRPSLVVKRSLECQMIEMRVKSSKCTLHGLHGCMCEVSVSAGVLKLEGKLKYKD